MKDVAKLVKVRQGLGGEKKREMGERVKAFKSKGKEYGQRPFRPSEKSLCRLSPWEWSPFVAATKTSNLFKGKYFLKELKS